MTAASWYRRKRETHDRVGVLALPGLDVRWLIDDPQRSIENAIAGRDGRTLRPLDFRQRRAARDRAGPGRSGAERPIAAAGLQPAADRAVPAGRVAVRALFVARAARAGAVRSGHRRDGRCLAHTRCSWPVQGRALRPGEALSLALGRRDRDRRLAVRAGWAKPRADRPCPMAGRPGTARIGSTATIQFLVGAGFTVLDPNYRGSTGYGRAFREAIKQDGWGGREQDDIRTGIESLVAAGKGRRGRIGIIGLVLWRLFVLVPDHQVRRPGQCRGADLRHVSARDSTMTRPACRTAAPIARR